MASAIIHLCVAKKVNENLKLNEKEFFLGSIAPDISKQVGESKINSHFLDADGKSDIPRLERFLEKYQDSLKDNAFNLGYYCHLYADMIWFGLLINNYFDSEKMEVIYKNGDIKRLDNETFARILYNDYTNLNVTLIDKYALDLSLFYENPPKIESEIDEIPIDKLSIIIDKMGLIIEESKERETVFLDSNVICRFIDKTAQDFLDNLKEIGVLL